MGLYICNISHLFLANFVVLFITKPECTGLVKFLNSSKNVVQLTQDKKLYTAYIKAKG